MPSPHRRHLGRIPVAAALLTLALVVLPASAPVPASAAPASTWVIDVNSVYAGQPFPGWGAAPELATVHFRTTLGVPNSTQVWVAQPYRRVCTGLRAGATCTVPDDLGLASFGNVAQPTLADIRAGARPELFGTVQWVTDASAHGDDAHLRLSLLRTGLQFGEQLTFEALSSGFEIGDRAGWVLQLFQIGVRGALGAWMPWPARVTAMVAVDPSLADDVNLGLLANRDHLFATAVAAVADRTLVQPFELEVGSRYFTTEVIFQR